ncbi:hypothetical protein CPB84DRAFT_1673217 [Gymnopilus junonius]|uniref:F-box domain-containing protein n=1 Tax=Gymnopilus junonius TaxID=109634 RepID=A0A9P5NYP4_GYMJU|nr:hypothetical protein CPB84DRAFT_1673217 [Gymnopilus junonius]
MADLRTSSYTTKDQNETTALLAPSFSRFQVLSILEDLPREILADIFTITCHDTLYGFFEDKYRYKRTTPFLLGHVCSEWRTVVWSTPEIWSHVALYLTLEKEDIQVALLEEWLSHSGEYPLTITIELEDDDGWMERIPEKLLRLLCSCANRWQSISWTLPESWYPILKKIKDSFSLLSTMSTGILFDHSEGRKQFDLFSRAPALRDVGLLNGFWISDVDLPWNQLIRLTLQRVFIDECLAVLSRTSQLKFLSLQEVLEGPNLLQDQQIELQALEHLVINESP